MGILHALFTLDLRVSADVISYEVTYCVRKNWYYTCERPPYISLHVQRSN